LLAIFVNPIGATRSCLAKSIGQSYELSSLAGLREPFTEDDFREACPGLGSGTYRAFLWKHRRVNRTTSELFELLTPGKFKVLRPLKYGFDDHS